MNRYFRPYGKKRGARRTGSRQLGSLGEALFFLFFFGVGAGGLALILALYIAPEWRVNRHFIEHRCVVLDTDVASRTREDGVQYRPMIRIRYRVDGETYETWAFDIHHASSVGREAAEAAIERFEVGRKYPCWCDPRDPTTVVLVRGYRWWIWLLLVLPISFVAIGGVGVVRAVLQSSTSAERRDALVRKASRIDLFEGARDGDIDYPHVPSVQSVTDSPGTHLAYRLPVEMASGWTLFGTIVLCLLWNGAVAWATARVVRDHLAGQGDLLATLVVLVFAASGIGLGTLAVRRLMLSAGVGATRIEVSAHPLYPGGTFEVFLSQTGRTHVHSYEALLACGEEAVYSQGTDRRVARQRVYQQALYRRDAFDIGPGRPFEARCQLNVPVDAMHSFKSDNNEVKWKLIVRADIRGFPDYERSFSIVVYPQSESVGTET